jgi:predicted ATPase
VGKSRLALEFHAQLPRQAPGWLWLEGRCQELAQNTGYAPFVDLLRSYWSWGPEEDEAARARSITTLLTELSEDRQLAPERVGEIGALLGRLFGLHFGDARERLLDQVDGVEVHRRTAAALCDLLVALAQRQPLVLVLEDLHWADTLSLELINLLMAHLPHTTVLLLCIYRPEQQHRAWQLAPLAARKCPGHFSQLMLNELTPGQSRLLIANLLGTTKPTHASAAEDPDALAPAMLQLILEKGQGNPLYLEELIYALIDSGHLLWEEGRWHIAAAFKLSAIPESLQSIIYSRLDALGSPWKQVVQQAAVIGRTFRRRLLAELISPAWDLDAALQRLSEAAFL